MSGPSTYDPKTGIERWLDKRLPIVRLVHDSFIDYPTPRNLNYFWTFGAILTFCLITQVITGIVLAMHYVASVDDAFASVQRIRRDVPFGWLIQSIHATGASMFFLAVYIHMFRGLYYGSYKAPREVLWIIGVVIYVAMIATAFLGYVLPWGQMSFWGATVITNFFTAVPIVGTPVQQWLMGGFAIDNPTLTRFFSLHYLLPFVIFGLVILHVWALHVAGQNNPDGIEVKDKADTVPFTPFATVKDLVAVALFA
ncbi:MAG: cytochrome b N-terminal domain-containing protein, partial [Hyphomonadaceae bacterium]|nr:cytochrome b N-terminal domain-containing protein [Hyphomonadaceae bacterium]